MDKEFIDEFYNIISAKKTDIELAGIAFPAREDDFGKFLEDMSKNAEGHPAIQNLIHDNISLFADLYHGSEYIQKQCVYAVCVTYKGHKISEFRFGDRVMCEGEEHKMQKSFSHMMASMPSSGLVGYLSDDKTREANVRNYLQWCLDFNVRRNWLNIWAYTDRVKEKMPEVYDKMIKQGEFLTVEELWEKAKGNLEVRA